MRRRRRRNGAGGGRSRLQPSSTEQPSAHLPLSLSHGELVEMQMYSLGKQRSLLRVKSQFLESHSEETIKAAPGLRLAAAPHA